MVSIPTTGDPTRRDILAAGAGFAVLGAAATAARAQDTGDKADFLFVQTADSMSWQEDGGQLTLHDISPVTLFFSDRPERIAGNMRTEAFIPFWSEGKDSFLSDPPNADMSIMRDGELHQTVVVLVDPSLSNGNLIYSGVRVIDGEMPAEGDEVSLFIDVIGMPLTPVSVAGVRRRAYRRAVLR